MSDTSIPDDVRRYIGSNIDSVPQLEALLLLRANPGMEWIADEVARRLYVDEKTASSVLAGLRALGFVTCTDEKSLRYRYEPTGPELAMMADRLAEVYARALIPVSTLIHSKPKSRIQQFADSFRLRKDS